MNKVQIAMIENQAKANWVVISPAAARMFHQQMEIENNNDRRDQNSID